MQPHQEFRTTKDCIIVIALVSFLLHQTDGNISCASFNRYPKSSTILIYLKSFDIWRFVNFKYMKSRHKKCEVCGSGIQAVSSPSWHKCLEQRKNVFANCLGTSDSSVRPIITPITVRLNISLLLWLVQMFSFVYRS